MGPNYRGMGASRLVVNDLELGCKSSIWMNGFRQNLFKFHLRLIYNTVYIGWIGILINFFHKSSCRSADKLPLAFSSVICGTNRALILRDICRTVSIKSRKFLVYTKIEETN